MAESPSVEYGALHKFFVSIGVFVVAGAAVVGWALLQPSSVFLTKVDELKELTPTAAGAIRAQQGRLEAAMAWSPVIVGSLALGGVALIVIGIIRWWPLQKMENAIKRHEHDIQLGIATPDETREKQSAEVTADLIEGVSNAVREAVRSDRATTVSIPRVAGLIAEQAFTEEAVITAAAAAYQDDYSVIRGVRVTDEDGRVMILDLLLSSRERFVKSYLVEFKRLTRNTSYDRFRETIRRAERAATLIGTAAEQLIFTRVLFIVDSEVDLGRYPLPSDRRKKTRILFVRAEEVAEMLEDPSRLRAKIG